MNLLRSITVDPRDAAALLAELAARRPGFLPSWSPASDDPGYALLMIASRFAQTTVQRVNEAPGNHKLAFLDMLGQQQAPARAARAPMSFQLANGVQGGSVPAGTGVAAPPPPGGNQQIVFETMTDTGISAAKLMQVFSFWPGRDQYIDHSADVLASKPITLFNPPALTGVSHVLYLAHPTLLNLSGNVVLSLEFQLSSPARAPLPIAWEYWDGSIWRSFAQLDPACLVETNAGDDATNGLTQSGSLRLRADAASSVATAVNNIKSYWIRGRVTETLPPDPAAPLPAVDSIRISSLVSSPLIGKLTGTVSALQLMLARYTATPEFHTLSATLASQDNLGGTVKNEAGQPLPNVQLTISEPDNASFGTRTATTATDGSFDVALDSSTQARNLQIDASLSGVKASAVFNVPPGTATAALTLAIGGLNFDSAYNDSTKLDTSKPFQPFGAQPQPGTTFYFSNAEIFSKPGARFQIYLPKTMAPSDTLRPNTPGSSGITALSHTLAWEYWNGRDWTGLSFNITQTVQADFTISEILGFRVPMDLEPATVNGTLAPWMRARLVSGGFGYTQSLTFNGNQFNTLVMQPPMLASAALGYTWQYGPFYLDTVLTANDFQFQDHTYEARWPGSSFLPFQTSADITPALYLGFDQPPPIASCGIYFDVVEARSGTSPQAMLWEYWDGYTWTALSDVDETDDLTTAGIFSYLGESDSAAFPRFGVACNWVRARLKEDAEPNPITINGIYLNAVWAAQQQTFQSVALGTATGQPGEVFNVAQVPVLPGERLEVQELAGPRANIEWRLIALELSGNSNDFVRALEDQLGKEGPLGDIVSGDLRLKRNKLKQVSEVWVRWYAQPNLLLASPTDRQYAIARARGLIFFGDGINGRIVPQDAKVQLQQFQSGGGSNGNVAVNAITQLTGAVSGVQGVTNVRPAEGGSDSETLWSFRDRAPASVRHRGSALTAGDYEAMAREASSAVAVVKALPNRNPAGRTLPGWLTLILIPESTAPQPWPSRGLRDEVLTYIAAHAPAGIVSSGQIFVTGPSYYPVDVYAVIAPLDFSQAGPVEAAASAALSAFLHPLHGGPSGRGWDLGRAVHLSDIARVLESVAGVDHAERIELIVVNEVQGDAARVPVDRIVSAGLIRLNVKAPGN